MTRTLRTGQSRADAERTAARLLKSSALHSHDPLTEIDWDAPPAPGLLYAPAHRISLYGTPLWHRMSDEQRTALSRHEVACVASVGIWFEMILMQMLLRYIYDQDPTTRHVQYALTEVGDECRHSVMFARLIDKLGCPAYGARRLEHELGRLLKTLARGPVLFASVLIAEELLDTLQREAMADETVQPIVRDVSRIHVIEESRHVRYAREELVRQLDRSSAAGLALTRLLVARSAYVIAGQLYQPRVYHAVGLDPKEAAAAARANPYLHATLRFAARRIVPFFDELGLIAGPGKALWHRAHLLS